VNSVAATVRLLEEKAKSDQSSGMILPSCSAPRPLPSPRSRLRSLSFAGSAALLWAEQEFAHAQLGDARRTRRLVRIAARAAEHPEGLVTAVFAEQQTEREAAYDFLENPAVHPEDIALAHHRSTAQRCIGAPFVFVPVDGSSLRFSDPEGQKGLGFIGSYKAGARGLKVMTAIAVSPDGVPLGVLGQAWWLRREKPKVSHVKRPVDQKETRYWLDVPAQAQRALEAQAPGVEPWFQYDREGDSWPVLLEALAQSPSRYTTVRANRDRCLVKDPEGQDDTEPGGYLRPALRETPVEASYQLDVPGAPQRKARTACMTLRFRELTLQVRDQWTNRRYPVPIFAVLAREEGTTPKGEKPLEWLLLTTYPVETVDDACLVLFGYAQRWRIEEFHAALKQRGCAVEDSQLRDEANLRRWATILSAVAMRLVRLTYLGRQRPQLPSSVELSEAERRAILLVSQLPVSVDQLTIGQAVLELAKLGGYTGKSSGGPPGFKVLARGLEQIRILALVLARGFRGSQALRSLQW